MTKLTPHWEWLDKCQQLRGLEPSRSDFDRYVVKYQLPGDSSRKQEKKNKRKEKDT